MPDYQGLGIGSKLLNYVCSLFAYHGKIVYLRTSNFKLIEYMKNSEKWFGNGKLHHSVEEAGELKKRKVNLNRLSASFKYVGGFNENYANDKISFIDHSSEEDKHEQLNLFDLL